MPPHAWPHYRGAPSRAGAARRAGVTEGARPAGRRARAWGLGGGSTEGSGAAGEDKGGAVRTCGERQRSRGEVGGRREEPRDVGGRCGRCGVGYKDGMRGRREGLPPSGVAPPA